MTTPPVDLDRIEALLSKATPGPWGYQRHATIYREDDTGRAVQLVIETCSPDGGDTEPCFQGKDDDVELLLAARNAAPAMVAELRALRAAVAAMRPFAGHADVGQAVCDSFFGNPCDCGWQEVEDAIPKDQP
jgi:hypothetical protein